MRRIAVIVAALTLFGTPSAAAEAVPSMREGAVLAVPLYGDFLRGFDAPPDDPYAPGHRGVDVVASVGTPVRASARGTVTFAGEVFDNTTVTVEHADELTTTYSYLSSVEVEDGQVVDQGEIVGHTGRGHPGSDLPVHVHLSVRRADVYIDPLPLYAGDDLSDLIALTG